LNCALAAAFDRGTMAGLSTETLTMPQSQAKNLSLIAAIDLGSNSFHMVVAKAQNGEIRILERLGRRFSWRPASTRSASSAKNRCSAGSIASSASPN
jgi:hypothetical protein